MYNQVALISEPAQQRSRLKIIKSHIDNSLFFHKAKLAAAQSHVDEGTSPSFLLCLSHSSDQVCES